MQSKQELDIYIDEAGDSSPYCIENPLYIVSFVCVESTDQNVNSIQSFQQKLSGHNGGDHFIHTGNLVRKEHPYKELTIQERQSLFGCMFFFSKKARFRYFNAVIDKKSHQEKPLCERVSAGVCSYTRIAQRIPRELFHRSRPLWWRPSVFERRHQCFLPFNSSELGIHYDEAKRIPVYATRRYARHHGIDMAQSESGIADEKRCPFLWQETKNSQRLHKVFGDEEVLICSLSISWEKKRMARIVISKIAGCQSWQKPLGENFPAGSISVFEIEPYFSRFCLFPKWDGHRKTMRAWGRVPLFLFRHNRLSDSKRFEYAGLFFLRSPIRVYAP